MSPLRSPAVALAAIAVALGLAACAPTVSLEPAPDAANPACAPVTVRLPASIDALASRHTDAQATGAWGEPAAVVLHCGVPVPPPTAELVCYTVDGIDWLVDDSDAPTAVLTTYGRDPAVTLVVDTTAVSARAAIDAVAAAVATLPENGHACISSDDLASDGLASGDPTDG